MKKTILITGAAGYVGNETIKGLLKQKSELNKILALDVREVPKEKQHKGVLYLQKDILAGDITDLLKKNKIHTIVHLASIVTPGKNSNREFEYKVDVLGTKNILEACIKAKVKKIIVTSSGAAYGYHADNPEWLVEEDAIRGNEEFAYSHHKRLVEVMLQEYREKHPALKQLIFRPGTILGANVKNQITNLFDKKIITGLRAAKTPFVIIWDEDVVACIIKGIISNKTGIYNLAGDGYLTLKQIAKIMNKPYVSLPVTLVITALWLMKKIGVTNYGPEQVNFLRYRPVLANDALKEKFGYVPKKTTEEVFRYYLENKS